MLAYICVTKAALLQILQMRKTAIWEKCKILFPVNQ
ncbi:hypothetical protein VIBHAR_02992 [Vibrio campbellii ATCC BAA-1116]|uniref:Uncharacterized protein n=1 Tax=Vibrio campbellii (strain ATCC BAA-1116) TaxID=2902295 RepID=A7MUL0_VIBC1|nr:hypothetical protein VIBHAR_02992 [Vibrio campbellii ATCC BAA-1116]